ncbi:MAG: hypothetical protein H0U70_06655 [Tatlockia sp.]|nr:hypothetical protein [Tatlockia sp.]
MEIAPHPQLLEALFVFRPRVSTIFRDVLGIHEIHHIAITQITSAQQILTFSSTPAMEFNLFNSNLWRYDKSYHPDWFRKCSQSDWQSLYTNSRYDELYYLKQVKHHYPLGYSLAAQLEENFFIYSFASHHACEQTRELFSHRYDDFYKIGQYCSKMLNQHFQYYADLPPSLSQQQVQYEASD